MCPLWALVLALAVGAGSWESGTATAGVWGTEYLLLGASCDGAPLQAAHTGQRTLGSTHWAWGAFPPARYLYLLPYLPTAEYLALHRARQLFLTSRLCLSNMRGERYDIGADRFFSLPALYYRCRASQVQVLLPLLRLLPSSIDEYCSSCSLLMVLRGYMFPEPSNCRDAAWSTSRSMAVCCNHLLQAAAWHPVVSATTTTKALGVPTCLPASLQQRSLSASFSTAKLAGGHHNDLHRRATAGGPTFAAASC